MERARSASEPPGVATLLATSFCNFCRLTGEMVLKESVRVLVSSEFYCVKLTMNKEDHI